jgi:S1-C subfamily serine protease
MSNHKKIHLSKVVWIGLLLPLLALACRAATPGNSNKSQIQVGIEATQAIQQTSTDNSLPSSLSEEEQLLIALYERINPAVVNITIYANENGEILPIASGSGFVFDGQGHIVTNAHVVHGVDQIEVNFPDGTVELATLVGEDLNSDLAVVKIEKLPAGVTPLILGELDNVAVGQTVVAIGNPFGFGGTLTRGIVSGIGRTIPALTPFSIPKAIQTDAPINPGNSGGPLLNLHGEVIGVNAQIITDGENRANSGVAFAIPVSIVKRVIPSLIQKGKYEWAWLGVRGTSLTPTIAEANGLPVNKGAYLTNIIPDGPADKAGLRGADDIKSVNGRQAPVGGDVVIAVNGQPVASFDDLLIFTAFETSPGQKVTLTILRDGAPMEVELSLEARPANLDIEPIQPILPTPNSP